MINGDLVHPHLLRALAGAGHGATVLLADGHYPASTAVGPHAEVVHLNLTPGVLDTTTVLRVLLRAVPVEDAAVMVPPPGENEPAAVAAHVADLAPTDVRRVDRWGFYDEARSDDLGLAVVTADVRVYANILLTIGVRPFAVSPTTGEER